MGRRRKGTSRLETHSHRRTSGARATSGCVPGGAGGGPSRSLGLGVPARRPHALPPLPVRVRKTQEKKNQPSTKDTAFVFAVCDPGHLFSKPRFSALALGSRAAVEKS